MYMPSVLSSNTKESVGSPSYEYDSMLPVFKRVRAIVTGERAVKEHDKILDNVNFSNLLIPFSPNMTQAQYAWYRAEAELPGLTSQYQKVLLAGLLRKSPHIKLPDNTSEEALDWINNYFTEDNKSLVSFLNTVLAEELTTTNGWIMIDFPKVENYETLSQEELQSLKPYPVLWKAEEVINFSVTKDPATGIDRLSRVIFRYLDRDFSENEFHPKWVPTVIEHYLDENNEYTIQLYQLDSEVELNVSNGVIEYSVASSSILGTTEDWIPIGEPIKPLINGQPFNRILCFPISGDLELKTPFLTSLVDKEISLYNKMSRRNHLLYGASTYTPVSYSDELGEEEISAIARKGLGAWLKLGANDRIEPISTPVDALSDCDRAIESTKAEMALLGIRILNPEDGQSGISLEIRNSVQIAQLGLMNTKISQVFKEIIALMLSWRYNETFSASDVDFQLSADFDPTPMGEGWVRTVTEWYQARLISRSTWIRYLKQHDMLPADYDDETALEEIQQDPLTMDQFGSSSQIQEE